MKKGSSMLMSNPLNSNCGRVSAEHLALNSYNNRKEVVNGTSIFNKKLFVPSSTSSSRILPRHWYMMLYMSP